MNFVFSKNKEKRSRSSTGESNSSFVKNVTSRVSGLLPAGITKWFSSPSSSSGNGSVAIADGTDSSTEDEAPESPSMIQPPPKRTRYASPPNYSQLTTSETTTTSNIVTETGSVLYTSIQSPPGRNTFRRETNFVSTPIRNYTDVNNMNMNSVMEQNDREDSYTQHTVSAIGQSIAQKRKSLFYDSQRQKEQSFSSCAKTAAHQMKDNQPYFKPHLFGSPFYPGRTMYGGASASSKYMNMPNIQQQKLTYVNESKNADTVNMSTSSRRVMDLLENYSSPLIEAKRLQRYEMSELSDINRTILPNTNSRVSYKTQELYVPTTATLIRMKARNRLMDSTKAARQIIASHSSTLSSYKPYSMDKSKTDRPEVDPGPAKSQSKLKTRLTRPNRGDDPFEMPDTVELPTVVLQIDKNNLPKFSFEGSISNLKPTSKPSNECFKFSSPLPVTTDAKTASPLVPAFDFGSPAKAAVNTSPPKFSFINQTSEGSAKMKQQPEKKDECTKIQSAEKTVIEFAKGSQNWNCPECWIKNSSEAEKCVCCGAKQPSKETAVQPSETLAPIKCTICKISNSQPNSDKCVNCEKMRTSLIKPTNSLIATTKAKSSKWKCGDCWVDNEEKAEKCACCGSRNPRQSAPATTLDKQAEVKPVAISTGKDWRCQDCLITNNPATEKCAACGGAKPGTKPAAKTLPRFSSTNLPKDSNNSMAKIVEAQKSYWECSVCLASNSNDKPTCLCCDAERTPQSSGKPKFSNFKFNSGSNTGFKFGIDPKVQETNLTKTVMETPKPNKIEESETNNNIVPKIPSFSFAPLAQKPTSQVDGSKTLEEPKPSFSFGIPKPKATSISTTFLSNSVSGNHSEMVKRAEDNEKPHEVPSISFQASETTRPPTGLFASPAPTANPQNVMSTFSNKSTEINKVSPSTKSPLQQSAISDKPKMQFSFSASAVKPSTGGLFSSPASTAIIQSSTTQEPQASTGGAGMFSKPEATAMSFFSKPETTAAPSTKQETAVTPSMSFFSKPESTPAPSTTLFSNSIQSNPAAPASTEPMFSFGNNTSTMPAPTNEPKGFNFTFGSSTTTPAFGAVPQTNTTTFSLPAANSLTNGPAGPLGGPPTFNPLAQSITGNLMDGTSGNDLASGNTMLGTSGVSMFNAPAKEPSMWPNTTEQTNQVNPFMASNPTKPAFSFGATPAPFGAPANTAQPLVFGASQQPAQNMFGMNQSNATQPSMFANTALQPGAMFAGAQSPTSAPPMMFGAVGATPFEASNDSMSTFEAPSLAPASAFNFGAPQASPGVFGFGQQPQQQSAMQQPGMQHMQQVGIQPAMYNFGGTPTPNQVQFNIGSAPNAASGRRMRKAVRKHPR